MHEVEIIISGHSYNTDTNFMLPRNMTVRFHAEYNETCFVPYDPQSVLLAYNERFLPTKQEYSKTVLNYEVHFTGQPFVGIFEVNNRHLMPIPIEDEVLSLKSICTMLKKKYPKHKVNIYGLFCRGEEREKIGHVFDFGIVNTTSPGNLNSAFLNELPLNTNSPMSNNNSLSSNGDIMDPFGFGFNFQEENPPEPKFRGKNIATLKRKFGHGGKRKKRQTKKRQRRKTLKQKRLRIKKRK
jgi:hypothetical protein